MPEIASSTGYVSVDLAAKVAGIGLNDMHRIVAAFAKGRTEPWFDVVLDVRTDKVLGQRHRDIRVASLPATMREALEGDGYRFLLAAEQAEPSAELGPPDFLLLHRAVHSGVCNATVLHHLLNAFEAGRPLTQASRDDFDCALDHFYGWGFQDARLPGVSADYRDFLERSRHHLGMTDRYYAAVLAELAAVDRPAWIDGAGFIRVANYLFQLGVPWALPDRAIMDRITVGMIHEARHQLGIRQAEHEDTLVTLGGGVVRTRDLDRHGFYRLQAAHLANGYRIRPVAPCVPGEPGFIRQPQVNLLWRLWCDYSGADDPTAFDRWIGHVGGVATLTSAGANASSTSCWKKN